jgi:PKD repeat protein
LPSVTLVPDQSADHLVGTPVTWTATVDDIAAPVYQFRVGPAGGPRHVVSDFSSRNTFTWDPMQEGNYEFQVVVKDGFAAQSTEDAVASYPVNSRVTGSAAVITATTNPLVALYSAPPSSQATVFVEFRAAGSNSAWQRTNPLTIVPGTSTNFFVAGLLPHTAYEMRHVLSDGTTSASLTFTTGNLSATSIFPSVTVPQPPGPGSDLSQGMVFYSLAYVSFDPADVEALATDLAGNVVWYYDKARSGFTSASPTTLVPGGTVLLMGQTPGHPNGPGGEGAYDVIREVDLAGNTVRETNMDAVNAQLAALGQQAVFGFDHDVQRLPNGNTAVIAATERTVNVNGTPADYIGNDIVVLNANFQVVWVWDSFNYLDVNRRSTLGDDVTGSGAIDWLHGNSIGWSPADGNLVFSMRHQDWVIKIDYRNGSGNGHVVWRLGEGGDFTINSSDPWPWFSHQHDARYIGSTLSLTLFDDGNTRVAAVGGNSRGQVLALNEQTMQATLTVNVDLGNYSVAVGSAQRLPNGNFVFTSGLQFGPTGLFGQSIEVLPDGTKAAVLQVPAVMYRSYRVSGLYNGNASSTGSDSPLTNLASANLPPSGSEGAAVGAVAGIATFTDADGAQLVGDYTAAVNWGDGTTSAGTVVNTGGNNFRVDAPNHTYAEEGTYTVTVMLQRDALPPAVTPGQKITVTDPQITNVGSANLPATGLEGAAVPFITGLATFTDPAGAEAVGGYTATVNWGDGTTSTGTVVNSGGNAFRVDAPSHTYTEEGTYTVTVTLKHDALPAVTTPGQGISVADAQITNVGSSNLPGGGLANVALGAIAGIATFIDPAGAEAVTDYTATVNWGDGTTSTATVVNTGGSNFRVDVPGHTYTQVGSYTVTVTLKHDALAALAAPNQTITVAARMPAPVVDGPLGQNAGGTGLVTFSAANGNAITLRAAGAGPVTAYVQVLVGSVLAPNTAGLTSASGNGTHLLALTGTLTALNAALDGLFYQAPAGIRSDYLNVMVIDAGRSGLLGTAITVEDTPDVRPAVSAPPQQAATAAGVVFATANGNAIHLSDGDANGASEIAYVQTFTGTVTPVRVPGVTARYLTPQLLSLSGPVAALNQALDGLRYTPAAGATADWLNALLNDSTKFGSAAVLVPISGDANLAPSITMPGAQAVAAGAVLTFAVGHGNGISVADGDSGGGVETVYLQTLNGRLTVGDSAPLISVVGNGTSAVALTGTLAALNQALDGLQDTPPARAASDWLSVLIDDRGNSGGPARTASAGVGIAIGR